MKRFLLLALVAIGLPCVGLAQQAATDESNVSWRAASQIAIRGNMIERVGGGVQSPEDDVIAELARLPADDSGKWHITVLTMPNCRACDKLKSDLATSKEWAGAGLINVQDHTKSWFHYNAYRYDDPTVRDWRRGLDAWLISHGKQPSASYPQLILQPPSNEAYGPKTEVVYWQVGYNGNPAKLRDSLIKEMQGFAKLMKAPQLVRDKVGFSEGGHGQEAGAGWTPPFSIPLAAASVPVSEGEWNPSILIPPTQAASAADLQLACPGAPAEFLFSLLSRGVTREEAAAAWLTEKQRQELAKMQEQLAAALEKLKNPSTPAPPAPVTPVTPVATNPLDGALKVVGVLMGGSLSLATLALIAGYSIKGILWLRQRKVNAGQTPTINEDLAKKLDRFDDLLIAFGEKRQLSPPPEKKA